MSVRAGELAETNGVKLGNGRVNLKLDAMLGYEANPNRLPAPPVAGDLYSNITPALDYKSSTSSTDLGANLYGNFRNYFGLLGVFAPRLGAELGLQGTFNKSGAVVFSLANTVGRYNDPIVSSAGTRDHVANKTVVGMNIKPGGGALEVNLGYNFLYDVYDTESYLDQIAHEPSAEIRWSFFPKTALYFLASYRLASYRAGATTFVPLTLGITGNFTSKLSAELAAGWSQSVDNIETNLPITGIARVQYSPTPSMRFKLGFEREFIPVAGFGFSEDNQFRFEYSQIIGARISIALGASFNLQSFGASNIVGLTLAAGTRADQFATADASVDIKVLPWLTASIYEALEMRRSAGGTGYNDPSYTHNDTSLRLTFHY